AITFASGGESRGEACAGASGLVHRFRPSRAGSTIAFAETIAPAPRASGKIQNARSRQTLARDDRSARRQKVVRKSRRRSRWRDRKTTRRRLRERRTHRRGEGETNPQRRLCHRRISLRQRRKSSRLAFVRPV